MAGIDKTYIDWKDYPNYRQWRIDNYDKMISNLGDYIWLYPFCAFSGNAPEVFTPEFLINNQDDLRAYKYAYDFPVWNTSENTDTWLVKNCAIQSYRDRLIEVYPRNWIGFKGQKWIPKPRTKQKYYNRVIKHN